ncbi:hypothetical protein [Sphingomonas sp. SRS2]|uniref:hypothetical protein n=1 Tax=Sphingomonas sp. SRS2 TaxID=133190 RepID=UPI0006184ACF|nr:hypothetical protein [Sphingomonas sp. SRS2]KKC24356.1 hypothetical protein WP12_19870 [Sphingomonas sp. SRS2]
MNLPSKKDRAATIISKIIELDRAYGMTIPGRLSTNEQMSRLVQTEDKWRAFITPNHRVTIGRLTERQVGVRYLRDPESTIYEVQVFNSPRLVVNMRGDEVHLHSYIPGKWESWFGVDDRDSTPFDRFPFADPKSPEWQALVRTADYQLPPLFDQPPDKPYDGPHRPGGGRGKRLR